MNLKSSLFLSLVLLGCKSVYFNPDFYVADSVSGGLVSERGEVVLVEDPRFNEYACLHKEKVKELRRLLMSKKIGGKNRYRVSQEYQQLSERFVQVSPKQKVQGN